MKIYILATEKLQKFIVIAPNIIHSFKTLIFMRCFKHTKSILNFKLPRLTKLAFLLVIKYSTLFLVNRHPQCNLIDAT